jgi:hypothetical protein
MADDRTIRVLLLALIIGLVIGTVYSLHSQQIEYASTASEQIIEGGTLGKFNTSVSEVLGQNGELLTYIRPPSYGTLDFQAYRAERIRSLRTAAGEAPERNIEATITFYPAVRTNELELYKNKYSLKLIGITGSSSGTLNYSEAPVISVNFELIGEKLNLFSRIHDAKAKGALFDLENLSR